MLFIQYSLYNYKQLYSFMHEWMDIRALFNPSAEERFQFGGMQHLPWMQSQQTGYIASKFTLCCSERSSTLRTESSPKSCHCHCHSGAGLGKNRWVENIRRYDQMVVVLSYPISVVKNCVFNIFATLPRKTRFMDYCWIESPTQSPTAEVKVSAYCF